MRYAPLSVSVPHVMPVTVVVTFQALFAVPVPLRNAVYSLVARNRYRIFGKYDECFVPDADMRARVIE